MDLTRDNGATSVRDIPMVFMSFDEPWAERNWQNLKSKNSNAKRVHGVVGLDACHKAAAKMSGGEWFITVDADTTVNDAFFDRLIPNNLLNNFFRLDWYSLNPANGLQSGNGCLKLWPSSLAMSMRTHELADKSKISIDHEIGEVVPERSMQVLMAGCYSESNPSLTPYHAFRAGFREGVYLSHFLDQLVKPGDRLSPAAVKISNHLRAWCSLGRHLPNGIWAIYGARLAVRLNHLKPHWDRLKINNYNWFNEYWTKQIYPRFVPGGAANRLSDRAWDEVRLTTEITALSKWYLNDTSHDFVDYNAVESRLIVESGMLSSVLPAAQVDALGRRFVTGKGVERDPNVAREYFEVAMVLGQPAAFHNLARLHQKGEIPDPDHTKAKRLFRAAIALGNPHASACLEEMIASDAKVKGVRKTKNVKSGKLVKGSSDEDNIQTTIGNFHIVQLSSSSGDKRCPNKNIDCQNNLNLLSLKNLKPHLSEVKDDWVVIVEEGVSISPQAMNIAPETGLMEIGCCFGYLAQCAVTGLAVSQGIRFCSKESILREGAVPEIDIYVPKFIGTWSASTSPELAFRSGYFSILNDTGQILEMWSSNLDLALAASVGADANNGRWWLLGANTALLNRVSVDTGWQNVKSLTDEPKVLSAGVSELARSVRLEVDIPVFPLEPAQSKYLKSLLPQTPPSYFWNRFVDDCKKQGPDAEKLGKIYENAADRVWGLSKFS